MRAHRAIAVALAVALIAPACAQAAGSPDVAALQVALRARGLYAGTVDGVTGPGTARAVRALQSSNGLQADGVAGAQTRAALGHRGGPSYGTRTLGPGDSGWDVAALQFRLAWRGFPCGNFDGGYGSHVAAAVRRFQSSAGLGADGVAGPATLRALRNAAIPRSPIWLAHPVLAGVGDRFGPRANRFHTGLDFPAPAGAPVSAAGRGQVASAGYDASGYGNLVVIQHPLGVTSWYAHLSRIYVSSGQSVVAGTRVGLVGATGIATGPHLHFEVRLRGAALDPLTALR